MDSRNITSSPQSSKKISGRPTYRNDPYKVMSDYRETLKKPVEGTKNFESNISDDEYGNVPSDDEIERSPSPMLSNEDNATLEGRRSPSTTSPARHDITKRISPSPKPLFRPNELPNMKNLVLECAEVPRGSGSNPTFYVMFIVIPVVVFAMFFSAIFTFGMSSAEGPLSKQRTCEELTNKIVLKSIDYMPLKVSVENTIFKKPTKPSVFVFLQDDPAYTNEVMNEIVNVTTTCFGSKAKFIKLDTDYFTSKDLTEDYGIAIEHVKDEFQNGGVLWIPDLDKVPAKVARAFHAICDTYSPLVAKLIVYFTLTPTNKRGNPIKLAEDTLRLLWKQELGSNELDPLITRVTDQVLWVPRAKL